MSTFDESVRLARMEAKLDSLIDAHGENKRVQEKHNDEFYRVRDRLNALEAKGKGAYFVVALVGAVVSWLFSIFKG